MPLSVTEYDSGWTRFRLTACPVCGHVFSRNEHRWKHLLDDHDPEDFGLSPLGEVPDDHDAPLFDPPSKIPGITEENAEPLNSDEEATFGLDFSEVETDDTDWADDHTWYPRGDGR